MKTSFSEMDRIFKQSKRAMAEFMDIITPIIESAEDDHERLYWHHIYEEEEHRADRLDILMPKIESFLENDRDVLDDQLELVHLLQGISVETFGLHNFLEHLDLSLFRFNGTEFEERIQEMRAFTHADYQAMKKILETLNDAFHGGVQLETAIPTDEKDGHDNLKIDAYAAGTSEPEPSDDEQKPSSPPHIKKGLTVGSLKK